MNSHEFERLMVGGVIMMGNCDKTREIMSETTPDMIDNSVIRETYKIACSLVNQAEALEQESVYNALPENFRSGFMELFRGVSFANLDVWARRVRECHMVRTTKVILLEAVERIDATNPENIKSLSSDLQGMLSKINLEGTGSDSRVPHRLSELMDDYMDVHERRAKGGDSGMYLKTGIRAMDEEYGGIDPTDLVIIAGRPGMGKTELTIAISNNVCNQRGKGLFVSLEMSEMQVVERNLADRGDISVTRLRNPEKMEQIDYDKLTRSMGELMEEDNYVIAGSFTVDEILRQADRLNRDNDLSYLAIDYLQLITLSGNDRKDLQIAEVTRRLKLWSLEKKVPVFLLSQLNRNLEQRPDKRPLMSDLRESGSIEQDADMIIFTYRDEVYNENSDLKGIAELIIGKYRSGKPTTFYQTFRNGHFKDIDQDYAKGVVEEATAPRKPTPPPARYAPKV